MRNTWNSIAWFKSNKNSSQCNNSSHYLLLAVLVGLVCCKKFPWHLKKRKHPNDTSTFLSLLFPDPVPPPVPFFRRAVEFLVDTAWPRSGSFIWSVNFNTIAAYIPFLDEWCQYYLYHYSKGSLNISILNTYFQRL